jgi:hypothetical protein
MAHRQRPVLQEVRMSRSNPLKEALLDLGDDIAYHAGNLLHRAFDLIFLLALGLLIYVTSIDPANAGFEGRAIFGVQARIAGTAGVAVNSSHAPTSCHLTNDLRASPNRSCTQALILQPMDI